MKLGNRKRPISSAMMAFPPFAAKRMHKQPVYAGAPVYTDDVEVDLFKIGMCLPSGPCVTDDDVTYIIETIKKAIA